MTEPKFTKGPWRHETSSNFGNIVSGQRGNKFYDGDDGFRAITTVQSCCASYKLEAENQQANINLIAAAPELYAELARIDPNNPVLAKARGESR